MEWLNFLTEKASNERRRCQIPHRKNLNAWIFELDLWQIPECKIFGPRVLFAGIIIIERENFDWIFYCQFAFLQIVQCSPDRRFSPHERHLVAFRVSPFIRELTTWSESKIEASVFNLKPKMSHRKKNHRWTTASAKSTRIDMSVVWHFNFSWKHIWLLSGDCKRKVKFSFIFRFSIARRVKKRCLYDV